MKTCIKCNESKLLSEFYKNSHCADGHLTICKACSKIYKQQNQKHAAAVEKQRRRRLGVKQKRIFSSEEERRLAHIEVCKRHQLRNKEKYDQYSVWYRKTFKKECNQRVKEWSQKNPIKRKTQSKKRHDQERKAVPPWTDFNKILDIYKQCEQTTKESGILHTVDHYYPILGKTVCGLHVADNLKIITALENSKKGNKHPEDFYLL